MNAKAKRTLGKKKNEKAKRTLEIKTVIFLKIKVNIKLALWAPVTWKDWICGWGTGVVEVKFCFPSSFDHIPQVLIRSVVSLNFSHKLKCIRNPTYFIFPQIKPHSTSSQVVYCSTKVRGRASALHCQPSAWVPAETSIIQSGPQGLTVISPNKMTLRCDTTLRWGCCAHFLWSLSFWTY